MSHGADTELLERAQAGDRRALDELLRRHEKQVYRFGLRMCGDEEAAKEVLQRTLLTAFEQLGSFRGEARVSTWLYTIARTFCGRYHRRTRTAPLHDVELDAPGGEAGLVEEAPDPHERAERSEVAELMAAAIGALPPEHREAVVLRDVEGLSAEEAAKVVGIGVPALKSRLHRGRQLLKAHLATLLREEGPARGGAAACPELAAQLAAIADVEPDQATCAAIEAHLGRCPSCAKALGELKDSAALCRRLPGDRVPPAIQRAVRAALHSALGLVPVGVGDAR